MVPSPAIRILPVQQLNHPSTCDRHGAISRHLEPSCPTAKLFHHLPRIGVCLHSIRSTCQRQRMSPPPIRNQPFLLLTVPTCRMAKWCHPPLPKPNIPPPITDMAVIWIQSVRQGIHPSICYTYGAIICFPQPPSILYQVARLQYLS